MISSQFRIPDTYKFNDTDSPVLEVSQSAEIAKVCKRTEFVKLASKQQIPF